jgi:hypothetical protein
LDGVQARGGERPSEPLVWPVFFAVDDATLLSLAGNLDSPGWIHAPGPQPEGALLSWQRELSTGGMPPGQSRFGYGLLYSAGGAKEPATQAAYQELVATVHALALSQAADATGMGALLAAFGGGFSLDKREPRARLEKLSEGIDPDEFGDELDRDLARSLDGFRSVSQLLAPLVPGGKASTTRRPDRREVAEPIARPAEDRPASLAAIGRVSRAEPGTVLAVTVQAWNADDVLVGRPIRIGRALRARGAARASLKLSGTLRREG